MIQKLSSNKWEKLTPVSNVKISGGLLFLKYIFLPLYLSTVIGGTVCVSFKNNLDHTERVNLVKYYFVWPVSLFLKIIGSFVIDQKISQSVWMQNKMATWVLHSFSLLFVSNVPLVLLKILMAEIFWIQLFIFICCP